MSEKSKAREIIITGAHRSGTSAISNFLANLGVSVGNPQMLLQQAQDNKKGFFERLDVLQMNDTILHCANSTWDNPDTHLLSHPYEINITEEIPSQIQDILGSFHSENNPFLLKDPRFSLTLPIWLDHLSQPLIIICIRNPLEIARSLQKRNGFSVYKGLAIWESYLVNLLQNSRNLNYQFVNFNRFLEKPEKYGKRIAEILEENNVACAFSISDAISKSFDVTLKHEECSDKDLRDILSVRQMELWTKIKHQSDISLFTGEELNFANNEALRQNDTDIGYSRLEIELVTDFLDEFENSKTRKYLVGEKEHFVFDVDSNNVKSFKLLPLNKPCVIKSLSFQVFSVSGEKTTLMPTEPGDSFEPASQWYYLAEAKPFLYYDSPFSQVTKVKINIVFATLESEKTSQLLLDYFVDKNQICAAQLKQHVKEKEEEELLLKNLLLKLQSRDSKRLLGRFFLLYHLGKMTKRPREFWTFVKYYQLIARNESLFSTAHYLKNNEAVNPYLMSPLFDFITFGWKEYRDPSPDFSVSYYLNTYDDIKQTGLNPLLHYISKGWREGRNPNPHFNTNRYIAEHPEILSSTTPPPISRQLQQEAVAKETTGTLRFESKTKAKLFEKPVAVIIPVYLSNEEAVSTLRLLIRSLLISYPAPLAKLTFIIIDDASPMNLCRALLTEEGFSNRSDAIFLENKSNLGFTSTINHGIEQASKTSDVVILNSDTEIYGSTFEILQRACYREPRLASVTPLSNKATISSLLDWPHGADSIYALKPKEISEKVEETGLIGPLSGTPTGHGFCMYLSRQALNDVGLFDAETFGRGYGEENDWSMRALHAGYKHNICTECFVFHHESKSFGQEQKAQLQKVNTEKLNKLYPYYTDIVRKYLSDDPLFQHRNLLKFFLLEHRKRDKDLQTVCFVIHDSFKNHVGGVQQHVKNLINSLNTLNRFELMVISPESFIGKSYEIHLFQQNEAISLSHLDEESLASILGHLQNRIDFLHVHHIHGYLKIVTEWCKTLKATKKVLTIHDYDLFCEDPFLMNDNGVFCLNKDSKEGCRKRTCQEDPEDNKGFLEIFDSIFVPSSNCENYVKQLANSPEINAKLEILPHFLPFVDEINTSDRLGMDNNAQNRNIVFLGSLYQHKGGDVFLECHEALENMGFQTVVWGHAQEAILSHYLNLPHIIGYKNWRELLELYELYGAHIVVLPAVCAETFSYTLFEALFLLEVPVIVGPYGNPSEVVRQHGVGEILSSVKPRPLQEAVEKIANNYSTYQQAVKQYKQTFYRKFSTRGYLEKYTQRVFGIKTPSRNTSPPDSYPDSRIMSDSSKMLMNRVLNNKAQDKIRVLLIHSLSKKDPPYFFRVENPKEYLNIHGNRTDVCNLKNHPLKADNYDVIYLSRTPLTDKLELLLHNAKSKNIPIILDVDDLIFHSDFLNDYYFLDASSPEISQYQKLIRGIEKTFHNVDLLMGSTPEISFAAQKYGKKSIYFRNRLRFSQLDNYKNLYKTKPQFKEFHIGYFSGSSTHDKDFNMLIPVLKKILTRHPNTRFLLMGIVQDCPFLQDFSANISVKPFESYERYLTALQRCRVIVTPLAVINNFSNAKSSIKFLEAAAVGTPVISSPINEMRYSIEHGVTGWLAGNESQWLQSIETAISGDCAEFAGESAHAYVMEQFSDGAESFCNLLKTIALADD